MPAAVVSASDAPRVILRASLVPTVVAGVLAVVVGGIVRGGPGALAAVIGTVVVVAFFAVGQYVLAVILERNPHAAMSAALLLYLVKIAVLVALIVLFQDATVFDPKVFGLTVLVCTLVWTGAEVWAVGRTRMLVVEPTSDPTSPGGDRG